MYNDYYSSDDEKYMSDYSDRSEQFEQQWSDSEYDTDSEMYGKEKQEEKGITAWQAQLKRLQNNGLAGDKIENAPKNLLANSTWGRKTNDEEKREEKIEIVIAQAESESDVSVSDDDLESDDSEDELMQWANSQSNKKFSQVEKAVKNGFVSVRPKKVDITHMFIKPTQHNMQERLEEKRQEIQIVKEQKQHENMRRTAVMQMMQDRQSEDRKVKELANKPLRFTRRCRGAFDFNTGKWKKKSSCKHRYCKFAHSQKQLEKGIRGCICSFDGGLGKCRKPHTCAFIHTVSNGDGLRRVETDDEYYQRTGYRIGEYRDAKSQGKIPIPKRKPMNTQKIQAVFRGYLQRLKWPEQKRDLQDLKREMTYRKLAEQQVQIMTITSYLREFRLDDNVKQKLIKAGVKEIRDILSTQHANLNLKPLEIKRYKKMVNYIQQKF